MSAAPKKTTVTVAELDSIKASIENLDEAIKSATTVKVTDVRTEVEAAAKSETLSDRETAAVETLDELCEPGLGAVKMVGILTDLLKQYKAAASDHLDAVMQEKRAASGATTLKDERANLVKRYNAIRTLAELDGADVSAYEPIGAPPARAASSGRSGTASSRVRTFRMQYFLNGKPRPEGESFSRFAMFGIGSEQKGQTDTLKRALADAGVTDVNSDWEIEVERSGKPVTLKAERVDL